MIKAEFFAYLHQSSVSHDPSEIILICWFAAKETFLIIFSVKSFADSYFLGNWEFFHLFPFLIITLKSRFKVQGSLLFVTYTIIQGIIGSEMLVRIGPLNGKCKKEK